VHRYRKVPVLLNVKLVGDPICKGESFDQFPDVAVTVCDPATAFHVTFVPAPISRTFGRNR